MIRLLPLLLTYFGVLLAPAQVPEFTKVSPFPIASSVFYGAAYGLGKFVAVSDTRIAYSSDGGLTWREGRNFPAMQYRAVFFGGDRFVAVGSGSITAMSLDGVNWVTGYLPKSLEYLSIAFGDGTFAFTSREQGGVVNTAFSNDGI